MLEQVQLTNSTLSKPGRRNYIAPLGYCDYPQLLTLDVVAPETLPILQLWPYAQYLKQQGMVYVDIELAFWRKVLQPLATLGLVLVAMSLSLARCARAPWVRGSLSA